MAAAGTGAAGWMRAALARWGAAGRASKDGGPHPSVGDGWGWLGGDGEWKLGGAGIEVGVGRVIELGWLRVRLQVGEK